MEWLNGETLTPLLMFVLLVVGVLTSLRLQKAHSKLLMVVKTKSRVLLVSKDQTIEFNSARNRIFLKRPGKPKQTLGTGDPSFKIEWDFQDVETVDLIM